MKKIATENFKLAVLGPYLEEKNIQPNHSGLRPKCKRCSVDIPSNEMTDIGGDGFCQPCLDIEWKRYECGNDMALSDKPCVCGHHKE